VWLSILLGVGGVLIFVTTTPELSCRRDDGGRVDCQLRRNTFFELVTIESLEIRGAKAASYDVRRPMRSGYYWGKRVLVEAEGGTVFLSRLGGTRIGRTGEFANRIDAFLRDPGQRSFRDAQSPWDWSLLGLRVMGYVMFSLGVLILGSPALNWLLPRLFPQVFGSRDVRAG
jgi:hypothetical protein